MLQGIGVNDSLQAVNRAGGDCPRIEGDSIPKIRRELVPRSAYPPESNSAARMFDGGRSLAFL